LVTKKPHGRSDWLGYWVEFVQKARFKKLACLCHIKQNDLTYLGRVCTPCLSVSTGIYGEIDTLCAALKSTNSPVLNFYFTKNITPNFTSTL
jgi:hypothetical protein